MKQYQSKTITPSTGADILAKADAVKYKSMSGIFSSISNAMAKSEISDRTAQAKNDAQVDLAMGELKKERTESSNLYDEIYENTALTLAEKQYAESIKGVVKKQYFKPSRI